MEQNIESLLTQDNFSLNHDVVSGECESTLESSGKYNPTLQFNGEAISLEINDVLLDFTTSQRTEGINIQQDTGFVCFNDLSAPGPIFEGDFGQGNGLVCLETNLTNTNQQRTVTLQKQSGWIDSFNNQECFTQSHVQQYKTNNEASKPTSLLRLAQNNEDEFHSVPIYQSEYLQKESKTTDTKKRKNSQVKHHPSHIDVMCEVCGGKATGFHYGADVCTGCKLFFYRNNKNPPPHSCKTEKGIFSMPCPGCRIEKCFKVGMRKQICRKGRYSYQRMNKYAAKMMEENKSVIPFTPQPITDEIIILVTRISEAYLSNSIYPPGFFENIPTLSKNIVEFKRSGINYNCEEEKLIPICPQRRKLDYEDAGFKRYTHGKKCLQFYHNFVKQLPGYNRIPETDRWVVFTRGLLNLLVVSEYKAYDVENGFEFHLDGTVVTREQIREHISPEYDRLLFTMVDRLQKLNLDENERNLLKLIGFFDNDNKPDVTMETTLVISQEQDVMIRAFDYVVRKNRGSSYQAAVTIGNAMQVISDTINFKTETGKHFHKSLHHFPANLSNWMKRTFLAKREEG